MALKNRRRLKRPRLANIRGTLRILGLLALLALVVLVLVLALRPGSQFINMPEIARVQRIGVLRVGVRTDVPGFSYENEQGVLEGLEVELAKALCEEIFPGKSTDVTLDLVPVTAFTARPRVVAGDIDITFSMQFSASSSSYAYSKAYYEDTIVILCKEENANIPLARQNIGLIEGSPAEAAWKTYSVQAREGQAPTCTYYASYPDLVLALQHNRETFIAVPGALVSACMQQGIVVHGEALGVARYVALCYMDTPAFSMLADQVIEDARKDGRLEAWVRQYGLSAYRYQNE